MVMEKDVIEARSKAETFSELLKAEKEKLY